MKGILIFLFLISSVKLFAQPDIKGGEYFIGSIDPGNGNGTPFTVADGAWNEVVENIIASAQSIPFGSPLTTINIRLKDNLNNWGTLFKKTIFLNSGSASARSINITQSEYFFGVFDPGQGSATPIIAFDGAFGEAVETVLKSQATWVAANGTTLFNIRVKDINGNWGPLFNKAITINGGLSVTRQINITQAEYFFGVFDPGQGSAAPILAFDGAFDEAVETVFKSQATWVAANGNNLFNIRVKDIDGNWGPLFKKAIKINGGLSVIRKVNITQAEYFFGVFDPGQGSATPILAFDGAFDEAVETVLKSQTTWVAANGNTLFNIRVKDINGNWGPLFKKAININGGLSVTRQINIAQSEYFFGVFDPGQGSANPILAFDGAFDEAVETVLKSQTNWVAANGNTLFNIRVKDINGNWGPLFKKTLFINSGTIGTRSVDIAYAEFFFGVFDPGQGQGTQIIAFDGAFDDAVESVLRTSTTWTVTNSPTLFNIRMKDAYNNWGPLFKKTVFPNGANPNAELIAQGSTTSVCPNSSVTLKYNGPNGYTPTWFNGTTGDSVTFNVSTIGYYGVSATSGNSTYVDSIYIAFLPTPNPSITQTGSILVCGSSAITLSTQVTANTTFKWFYNGSVIGGAISSNYLPTQTGDYYVTATSTNNGCTGTSPTTKLISTASITPSGTITTCNSLVILSAASGTGNSYQWKFNGVNINGATSSTYSSSASGNYSVTITNGACVSTSPNTSVNITSAPTVPSITANGPTTFCAGGSVTLTSSSTTGNTWSNGATTQSITVTNSGSYSVTVSNGTCTTSSSPTLVSVNILPATPTITASGPTTFCTGGSVLLTSSSPTGNTWSNGATTQSITANSSGNYTVAVSNGNCSATSIVETVNVNILPSTPVVSANGPTTFCAGGSVLLTSSSATGNTWSNGATTQLIIVNSSGNYTVAVSNGNCSATSSVATVTVNPPPSAPVISANGPTTFCAGGSVSLTSPSTTGNTWSNGATTQSITVSNSGSYSVTHSNGTCTASSSPILVTVNIVPATPTITTSGPTNFCSGGSVVLTSSSATGNTWSNGATTQSITVSNSGSYTVTFSNGTCTATSSPILVTVNTVLASPTITTTVTPVACFNGATGAIALSVSGDNPSISNPGLLISELQTDPALADSPKEWVELIATRSINFAQTPYTVIFSNNGTATSKGWVEGNIPSPPPRNSTYAFQINTGSVQPGDVVYVGGTSMAPTGVRLRQKNTATEAGDGNIGGAFAGATGVLGNGGGIADGVAVFDLPAALVDSNTVPVDAIFFGSGIGDAAIADTSLGFRLPVNDRYMGGRLKSSSYLAPEVLGFYSLKANGSYNRNSGVYSTPRTWSTNTTAWASSVSGITVNGYTYLWSNGATTKDIFGLTAGTYTVTVTSGSCTVNGTYTVTQSAALNISLTTSPTSCVSVTNGAANASVNGGVAPYTYLWSNGSTTAAINQLIAGAYTVTVSDVAGCTIAAIATINTNNNFPSVTLSPGSVICNGATNGSISSSANGGVTPYTYLWSNGSTVSSISNLAAGTYTLTVTAANGCASTQSADVQQTASVSIISILPSQSNAGYPVNLRGSGLAGITQVKFNGVNATSFTISGDTLITVTVPLNAGSGPLQLLSNTGCSYQSSLSFTYLVSSPDLTVKLYIQGLYLGGGFMESPLVNSGLSGNAQYTDSITLQLAQPTYPHSIVWTGNTILRFNGIAVTNLPGTVIGQSYYIVVKHRSSLETWSKHPVVFGPNTYWNFSGLSQFPAVTTTAVSIVQNTTALSGGTITSDGGSAVTARGVCWSTVPGPTVALANKTINGSGTGSFTSNLSGLSKNTTYYMRAYVTNGVGTAYGNEISFTTLNLPVDIDGNTYDTIVIGSQVWMSKNLRVSKYRNGDSILTNLSNTTWQNTTSGAYAIYNNIAANDSIYGKLYNWYAVADPRGLCPTGWHVPSDEEWQTLETALGMPAVELNITGGRGSSQNVGGKMKEVTPLWLSPNTGASSGNGFSGLPAGYRGDVNGSYYLIGNIAIWWSNTQVQGQVNTAYNRILSYYFSHIRRDNYYFKFYGFSVRCVRD